MQSPPPYGLDDEPIKRLNLQIYQENQDQPLTEVLVFFHSTYQRTLNEIQNTPEELLRQKIHFQEREGPQVWEVVAANTFEHDHEHHDDILAWLDTKIK
jgi:hypothetical protein